MGRTATGVQAIESNGQGNVAVAASFTDLECIASEWLVLTAEEELRKCVEDRSDRHPNSDDGEIVAHADILGQGEISNEALFFALGAGGAWRRRLQRRITVDPQNQYVLTVTNGTGSSAQSAKLDPALGDPPGGAVVHERR